MGKVSVLHKKGVYTVTNRLEPEEEVNHQEWKLITRNPEMVFLPVEYEAKNKKKRELRCEVEGYTPLRQYCGQVMRKCDFFALVEQVIDALELCKKNKMDLKNIHMDVRYVFVDDDSRELRFLYWPLANNTLACSLKDFFEEWRACTEFYNNENRQYLVKYDQYFEEMDLFSLNHFKRFVTRLAGAEQQKGHFPGTVVSPATGAGLPQGSMSLEDSGKLETRHIAVYTPPVVVGGQQAVATQQASVPEPLVWEETPDEQVEPSPVGLPLAEDAEPEMNGYTTLLGMKNAQPEAEPEPIPGEPPGPWLLRCAVEERIPLRQGELVVGKSAERADYVVEGNSALSRQHARLTLRGADCFLEDLDTTNHTFINGEKMIPGAEYLLQDGDEILMANERFLYLLEGDASAAEDEE